MSNQHLVGIAQIAFSEDPSDILIAPNLGSCLGIAVYDPQQRRGGVIHCLLPLSKSDPQKAALNPCMFVDTGLAVLLDSFLTRGSDKKALSIVAVGGANISDDNNVFEIGKRNYTILKKMLWKNGLLLRSENVGDSFSRTLSLHIADGKTFLKARGVTSEI